jgi:hypothetical protein
MYNNHNMAAFWRANWGIYYCIGLGTGRIPVWELATFGHKEGVVYY